MHNHAVVVWLASTLNYGRQRLRKEGWLFVHTGMDDIYLLIKRRRNDDGHK